MSTLVSSTDPVAVEQPVPPALSGRLDAESRAWVDDLLGGGARYHDAVERLHGLLPGVPG